MIGSKDVLTSLGEGWEKCDSCDAPLDERQRYCVSCGARRPNADDPAGRYFSQAARRSRTSTAAAEPLRQTPGTRTAVIIALLPIVAAIGVFVGRSGSGDDDKLLDAIKSQKTPVVAAGQGSGANASADVNGDVVSNFSLPHGFAVAVRELPTGSSSSADVDDAVSEAKDKDAADVAIVSPKDFEIKPNVGSSYLVVSGAFGKRGDAEAALGKLKSDFPDAKVVELRSKDANAGNADGDVIAKTNYGTARKLTGSKVTPAQLDESKKALDHIVNSKGKDYVEAQRNLPDQIIIP